MDEELEKLYKDLLTNRQTYRGQTLTVSPPHPNQNLINFPTAINYDFASLYPSFQKKYYNMKVALRKRKIKNIFQ
jgi:translation elongation factor EF-4